ncbi:MAG TPA: protein kinase family protein [Thermoanaerobaculia bacterium]|nr:protein kinase family protein [Thermoanaerobaculia bacterium]
MSVDQPHPIAPPVKSFVLPSPGEVITSLATGTTYTMGESIGEGSFGLVFACTDGWRNDLAVKVMKPVRSYDEVQAATMAEVRRLLLLRHPHITYVYDAFEHRDTFYIVTERCYCPLTRLFTLDKFDGLVWMLPIARCLLQAVQYLHVNQYAHQDIHLNNAFAAFARDEMSAENPGAIQFKLGDLGVSKVFGELDAANTLAEWIRPPEALDIAEYGPLDHRIDIYHLGLVFLQLAHSRELRFTQEEILDGRPREMALQLAPPLNFALEKALRRHAAFRTRSAEELWRDLQSPPGLPGEDSSGAT